MSRIKKRIAYYFKVAKWLWQHRNEKPCRQKTRRMLRELDAWRGWEE